MLLKIFDFTIVLKMSGRKYGKNPQIHRQTNKTNMKFVFLPKYAYSLEDVRVGDGLGMGVVVLYMLSIFLGKSVGLSCSQQEIRDHNKQYVYDKCNLHYI